MRLLSLIKQKILLIMGNGTSASTKDPFTLEAKPGFQGQCLTLPANTHLTTVGQSRFDAINGIRAEHANLLPPPGLNFDVMESPYFAFRYNDDGTLSIYEFFLKQQRVRRSHYRLRENGLNPDYIFNHYYWTCCGYSKLIHPPACCYSD